MYLITQKHQYKTLVIYNHILVVLKEIYFKLWVGTHLVVTSEFRK